MNSTDSANLKSLAIAFRIIGVLYGLGLIVVPIIFGLVQYLMVASQNATTGPQDAQAMPSAQIFPVGILVISVFVLAGFLSIWLCFKAARSMERKENWGLCIGVSIFFLSLQPLGLILGILALIVLNRSEVRQAFT